MARIETKNYYELSEAATELNRDAATVRQWLETGWFKIDDLLIVGEVVYIKKKAVDNFKDDMIV